MKRTLLDTNAFSALMSGDEAVFDFISRSDLVHMSVVVIGELEAGFRGGTRYAANKEILARFLAKPTVNMLEVTTETAEIFGEIKVQLKHAGDMVPINDIWIAAHAVETGSQIITYDNHFTKIVGIRMWQT